MGLLDKLFGTKEMAESGSKAIGAVVDSVTNGVDKFIYTKAEKAVDERLRAEQDFRFNTYDKEFVVKLIDKDLEYYKVDAADRVNARQLADAEISNSDVFIRRFRYIFGAVWSLFGMIYFLMVSFMELPKENQRFVDMLIGSLLTTVVGVIIQFFFGSSHGSMMKDAALDKVLNQK